MYKRKCLFCPLENWNVQIVSGFETKKLGQFRLNQAAGRYDLGAHVAIQMKAMGQYFLVVLFIMLNKVVLTFESMDKIPASMFPWYCSVYKGL